MAASMLGRGTFGEEEVLRGFDRAVTASCQARCPQTWLNTANKCSRQIDWRRSCFNRSANRLRISYTLCVRSPMYLMAATDLIFSSATSVKKTRSASAIRGCSNLWLKACEGALNAIVWTVAASVESLSQRKLSEVCLDLRVALSAQ